VIAIIGLLAGILLPAISSARESARRMQCTSNLRQIVLGTHLYEEAYGSFPTNFTGCGDLQGNPGSGFYSWIAQLLPFLDEGPLHRKINFNLPLAARGHYGLNDDYSNYRIPHTHPNAKAAQVIVQVLLCPSDPAGRLQGTGLERYAPGSYVGNVGWPKDASFPNGFESPQQNGYIGLFNPAIPNVWQRERISFSDLTDGSSNTSAISERMIASVVVTQRRGGNTIPREAPDAMKSFCGGSIRARSLDQWVNYCQGVSNPDPVYSLRQGHSWITGWTFAANTYMHVMPPNGRNCHVYGGEADGNNLVAASSHHRDGMNVAMADGRIDFRTNAIDMRVWWTMGSGNDGLREINLAE
jgi:type II secretory pathway pseudopilin PulG